jgi:opacity protein-like surface antigen
MKNSVLAALALALLSSSAALAADPFDRGSKGSTKEAVVSSADRSWSGLWLGAFGGYTITNTELGLDHVRQGDGGTDRFNLGGLDGLGGEGFFGEAQVGFDKQVGERFVIGVLGGVGISNSETTISGPGGVGVASIQEDISYLVGGRLGYLVNRDNMVYVAGGYRWVDVDITGGHETIEETFEGLFGEVGLESHIGGNAYLRVAGRYTAFDDRTFSSREGDESCWNELNVEPGKLEAMVGLTFKLGGGDFKFD